MIAALAAGEPVTLGDVDQFVDGAAVNRAGTLTYAALAAAGDMVSVTTVDEGAVCTAMLDLYQNEGIVAEPAGALVGDGVDGKRCRRAGFDGRLPDLGRQQRRLPLRRDPRAVAGAPRAEALLPRRLPAGARRAASIPRPVLGPNDDITLFEYVKRNNRETGAALVGVELGSAEDYDGLLTRMRRVRHRRRGACARFAGVPVPDQPVVRSGSQPSGPQDRERVASSGCAIPRRSARPTRAPLRR